ncbi:hypothetical protein D3C76_165360 [compost metagenome]
MSHELIKKGMARAFFGSAYADMADDCGKPLRGEIMDQLPAVIDSAALHAADTLAFQLEMMHGQPVAKLFEANNATNELTAQEWGHYAAMQSMGHGVGLFDYDIDLTIPHVEFGSHSLSRDYFTE